MAKKARSKNQLLSLLPKPEYERLAQDLEKVRVPARTVVCEIGEALCDAHFPLTNLFSSVLVLEDGTQVEAVTIGNEGMLGVMALLDQPYPSPHRILHQVEGESLRISGAALQRHLAESDALRQILTRYALVLFQQSAQNAACNLHHTVEERMARWLLTSADRAGRNEFELTQEFLSQMLGVRRQTVNLTAGLLQQAGVIAYRWGRLTIRSREALEQTTCECYRMTNEAYQGLMHSLG